MRALETPRLTTDRPNVLRLLRLELVTPVRALEVLERLVPVSPPTPLRLLTPKVAERALKKLLRLLKVNGLRNGRLKTGLLNLAAEPLRKALIARLLKRAFGPTRPLAEAM